MTSVYRALDHVFTIAAPALFRAPLGEALAPLALGGDDLPADTDIDEIVVSKSGARWTISTRTAEMGATTGAVIARVLEHVNRCAAASVFDAIPLHAAAVRCDDDAVIALAGRSGAGKSTLGAAAISAGWGFLAEEVAAVEPTSRRVRPYHRPVGLRRGGAAAVGMEFPVDDALYDDVYPWPVPAHQRVDSGRLAGIALVSRTRATGWTPVRPAEALAELIEHAVVPDDVRIVPVFRQLDALVRRVPVVRIAYADVTEGVDCLDELAAMWQ